ncbi:MAG: CDP-alcohol phosphatidyltransferase family protein, partial [Bacteroidales bacterium]|nr:CDP-alcohol phosphatidyltransferase family protein [Bacteroidales bacterium]
MKKHIPNMITCSNLISGCIATVMAIYGNPTLALLWIVVGAVFDFFDGMTARLLHVSSPIGKELDSLADVVTFGVAPSAILYAQLSVMDWPASLQTAISANSSMTWAQLLSFMAFIMAAFSALRLAKFNLDERQAMGF